MTTRPTPEPPVSFPFPNQFDAVAAMFANQAEWLMRNVSGTTRHAGASPGSHRDDLVAAGAKGVATCTTDPQQIDESLSWLRTTGSADVLVWSAAPNDHADLHLLARGCRDSFRPRWMWRSLAALPAPVPMDPDVEIVVATMRDREALLAATTVPYVSASQIVRLLEIATSPETPRRAWMLIARRKRWRGKSTVMGVGILHLSDHEGETNGAIFNLGVDSAWRGNGIGSGLTSALCRIARDHGAVGIALNATPDGERIYRKLDFVTVGDGQTWFMPGAVLRDPPSPMVVANAEALARGETGLVDRQVARWPQMPNGESPIRYAARFGRRAAIEWLIDHGADPDIAPLWAMGLREEAVRAAGDPRWLDIQRGPESTTALHDAIRLNDGDLVRMLLAAGADLTIRDSQWHGRAIEWAEVLGHPDLAEIIRRAM